MEDHPVRAVVLQSNCPRYQVGDIVVFEGAFVDKEKSAALCMVALNAIYPFVYAARRGGSAKSMRTARNAMARARLRLRRRNRC